MILHIFTVFDRAANVYGRPFFAPSRNVAIRSFTDEVNRPDENSQLYKHPDDFDLYSLGEFNDESGQFDVVDPQFVIRASDLIKSS